MAEKIKVIMNGAAGRMGRALAQGLGARENMRLAAAVDTKASDVDYGLLCGLGEFGFKQELDLAAAVRREQPDVVVDFQSGRGDEQCAHLFAAAYAGRGGDYRFFAGRL